MSKTRTLTLIVLIAATASCSDDEQVSSSSTVPNSTATAASATTPPTSIASTIAPPTTAPPTTVRPTTVPPATTTLARTTVPNTPVPTTAAPTTPPPTAAPTTTAVTTTPPLPTEQLAPVVDDAIATGLCGQQIPTGNEDPPRELPQDGGSVVLVECERYDDQSAWAAAWYDGASVASIPWAAELPDGTIEQFQILGGNLSVEPSGSVRVVSQAATDCDVRVYRPTPAGMELLDQQTRPCPP